MSRPPDPTTRELALARARTLVFEGRVTPEETIDLIRCALAAAPLSHGAGTLEHVVRPVSEELEQNLLARCDEHGPSAHVIAAAARFGGAETLERIRRWYPQHESDPELVAAMIDALGTIGGPTAVDLLIDIAQTHADDDVAGPALAALGELAKANEPEPGEGPRRWSELAAEIVERYGEQLAESAPMKTLQRLSELARDGGRSERRRAWADEAHDAVLSGLEGALFGAWVGRGVDRSSS